jgi:hypothetical protein
MKKLSFIALTSITLAIMCSCGGVMHGQPVVTKTGINYTSYKTGINYTSYKYKYSVEFKTEKGYVELLTNHLYKVGDTLK